MPRVIYIHREVVSSGLTPQLPAMSLPDHLPQVGKKGRKKLLRSEELLNEMQSIDEDFIYIQGMRDCAALLRLFGLL